MKIRIVQKGGFAGINTVLADLDTANLRSEQSQQLETVIARADFFRLPMRVGGEDVVGADMFEYEVTVTDKERKQTVAFVVKETAAEPLASILHAADVK